jgi:hypothetical protein
MITFLIAKLRSEELLLLAIFLRAWLSVKKTVALHFRAKVWVSDGLDVNVVKGMCVPIVFVFHCH